MSRLVVSFSGGQTSAYMGRVLQLNCANEFELLYVFANTGEETEATLAFTDRCDKEYGWNVVWLEAEVHHDERKCCTHRVVTFETASRHGQPFEQVIKKYGIPNLAFPHCTRELKVNPIRSYLNSIGWDRQSCQTAIGIRADEAKRVKDDAHYFYPLVTKFPTDKQDVNSFWEDQPFRLGLQEHQGNCKWCWKKSLAKHMRLISENASAYDFPRRMEKQYPLAGTNPDGIPRVFFREKRSVITLFALHAELKDNESRQGGLFMQDADAGCSESCEAIA